MFGKAFGQGLGHISRGPGPVWNVMFVAKQRELIWNPHFTNHTMKGSAIWWSAAESIERPVKAFYGGAPHAERLSHVNDQP